MGRQVQGLEQRLPLFLAPRPTGQAPGEEVCLGQRRGLGGLVSAVSDRRPGLSEGLLQDRR